MYLDGGLHVQSAFSAPGSENFVQTVRTDPSQREVAYTAVEAGPVHTETAGVAELTDGGAVVELPEHFELVTSDENDLVVQVIPHSADADGPAVVDRSPDRIVLKDCQGTSDYELSCTVWGTRRLRGQAGRSRVDRHVASRDP